MNESHGQERKAGVVWMTLCVLAAGANAFSAFLSAAVRGGSAPYAIGAALGSVIVPLVVVLIFQLGGRFRNGRSRAKIFFFTSVFSFLANFSLVGRIVSERAGS